MHTHTMEPLSVTEFGCEGCGLLLRLATQAEAVHVHDTGAFGADGPLLWQHNMVLVPFTFDVWEGFDAIEA